MIGLSDEIKERIDKAVASYRSEIEAITEEVLKDCKTVDDMEVAMAVMAIYMDKAVNNTEKDGK